MDLQVVIRRFLEGVGLPQFPFLTEEELEGLFGVEVMELMRRLDAYSREHRLCLECGGMCCQDIGCEVYLREFGGCPIQEVRPVACRFHFCHRFGKEHKEAIIALRDTFLGCYMTLDASPGVEGSRLVRCMDAPPLAGFWPELGRVGAELVGRAWDGATGLVEVRRVLLDMVWDYRARV